MAPIRRQRKSSDTKQRSFHLTDDVYNIVEREAAEQGVSNSAWVSHLIFTHASRPDDIPHEPHSPERIAAARQEHRRRTTPTLPADAAPAAPQPAKRTGRIALPDENVSEFSVDKTTGQVRGKRLRSDDELSGVERAPSERKKGKRRNEEIEL